LDRTVGCHRRCVHDASDDGEIYLPLPWWSGQHVADDVGRWRKLGDQAATMYSAVGKSGCEPAQSAPTSGPLPYGPAILVAPGLQRSAVRRFRLQTSLIGIVRFLRRSDRPSATLNLRVGGSIPPRLTTHILHRKALSAEPSRSLAKARMRLGCAEICGSNAPMHPSEQFGSSRLVRSLDTAVSLITYRARSHSQFLPRTR
jgi:hypothetical protein